MVNIQKIKDKIMKIALMVMIGIYMVIFLIFILKLSGPILYISSFIMGCNVDTIADKIYNFIQR